MSILSALSNEWHAAVEVFRMMPALMDERRWARTVAYVEGPTCIVYLPECAPKPHAELWPFKRVEKVIQDVVTANPAQTEASVTKLERPRKTAKGS